MNRENFEDSLENLDKVLGETDGYDETEKMTIISALDRVVGSARNSGLGKAFWDECGKEINFLCQELKLTEKQVVIVGILCEFGYSVSWRQIGQFMGLTRLRAMTLTPELEGLKKLRWVNSYPAREKGGMYEGFRLTPGVVTALRNNQPFEPENLGGMTEQMFVDRLVRFMRSEGNDDNLPLDEKRYWLNLLTESNKGLPLCQVIESLGDDSKILLLLAVYDYALYAYTDGEGLWHGEIEDWFQDCFDLEDVVNELKDGSHELFKTGLFEFGTDDGLVDSNRWKLTSKAKEDLLGEFTPRKQNKRSDGKKNDRDLRSCSEIIEKCLFYNPSECHQIARIKAVIATDGFDNIKSRLTESGFRSGITCLLYGAPGTGKTETVLQLARETGRDILHVNIAGLRDKWVGESEKNIKMVFDRYRKLCSGGQNVPILLFNEADAIFGCRFKNVDSSVEKMDNAIQNIILQEMETFEGILIATTNLTGNLDPAFDRRFLFKVEFEKPCVEAKQNIWHTMLPDLTEDECNTLAFEFDFSGGQIENIARKCKIDYITTGNRPDLPKIQSFCREEHLNRNNRRPHVGF